MHFLRRHDELVAPEHRDELETHLGADVLPADVVEDANGRGVVEVALLVEVARGGLHIHDEPVALGSERGGAR